VTPLLLILTQPTFVHKRFGAFSILELMPLSTHNPANITVSILVSGDAGSNVPRAALRRNVLACQQLKADISVANHWESILHERHFLRNFAAFAVYRHKERYVTEGAELRFENAHMRPGGFNLLELRLTCG
jgi:hypothetical protein